MALSRDRQTDLRSSGGYETADVNIRAVLWLAAGIAIGTTIVMAGLWLLWTAMQLQEQRRRPATSPVADTHPMPPPPQLQMAPADDYRDFRGEEEKLLHSYGWVDRQKNLVRLPIERAMKLITERGEPVLQPPQPQTEQPAATPAAGEKMR